MASSSDTIVCSVCGAKNGNRLTRCQSCGAKLELLSEPEAEAGRDLPEGFQQEGFSWKWVSVALLLYIALEGLLLGLLPKLVDSYDPQGGWGMIIAAAIWFVGAIVVGFLSPHRTFIEPVVGVFIAVIPTIAWLQHIADWAQYSLLSYVIFGMLGIMLTLMGSFLGERIQGSGRRSAQT
ncbi:MAG: hypothetical protein OEY14_04980 [Myxococcales bacterium]|nr:hypothetical protein [Myxococcales bacterium]